LHRRHVGQVFVVDHQVNAGIPHGPPFRVGLHPTAAPSRLLRQRKLRLQKRLGQIQKDVADALPFEGQQLLRHLARDVA